MTGEQHREEKGESGDYVKFSEKMIHTAPEHSCKTFNTAENQINTGDSVGLAPGSIAVAFLIMLNLDPANDYKKPWVCKQATNHQVG